MPAAAGSCATLATSTDPTSQSLSPNAFAVGTSTSCSSSSSSSSSRSRSSSVPRANFSSPTPYESTKSVIRLVNPTGATSFWRPRRVACSTGVWRRPPPWRGPRYWPIRTIPPGTRVPVRPPNRGRCGKWRGRILASPKAASLEHWIRPSFGVSNSTQP